jgi:hypothetical protein
VVALLIDAENTSWLRADFLQQLLRTVEKHGDVRIRRAYASWKGASKALRALLLANEFTLIETNGLTGHGNAADIRLAIDATELACTDPSLRTFTLVTGDSDFVPLFRYLSDRGLGLVGCVPPGALQAHLQPLCREMVLQPAPSRPAPKGKAPPRPSGAKTAVAPSTFQPTDEQVRKCIEAELACVDDLTIPNLHARLKKTYPGFSFRSAGVKKFATYLKRFVTISLKKDPDGTQRASLKHPVRPRAVATGVKPAATSKPPPARAKAPRVRPEAQVREERLALMVILANGRELSLPELHNEILKRIPKFDYKKRGFSKFKDFVDSQSSWVELTSGPNHEQRVRACAGAIGTAATEPTR